MTDVDESAETVPEQAAVAVPGYSALTVPGHDVATPLVRSASEDTLGALAKAALLEITRDDTIGEQLDVIDGPEGTRTVRFANTLPGYPGWVWAVSVAELEGQEPTVLETELIPGDDSLLAPDWVPWVERLAEYEASQEAAGAEADPDDESIEDESDDDRDDDDTDDDDEESDDDFEDTDDDDLDDDLGDDEFDGVDVEEAAEAAGLDESGDDDESDDSDRP